MNRTAATLAFTAITPVVLAGDKIAPAPQPTSQPTSQPQGRDLSIGGTFLALGALVLFLARRGRTA